MQRFKLQKLLLIITSMLFATSAFASETRITTMGGNGLFLKDEANVMLFPATLLKFSDLVVAEMRAKKTNSVYSVGIHMDYGNNLASGLYINMPITSPIVSTGLGRFGGLTATLNNGYGFLMGMGMGDMDIGFGLLTAGSNFETGSGDTKTTESSSYIGVLGGVSNAMLDAGILIELPSITQEIGSGKTEYSGFGFSANGRYFLMKRNGTTIFPVGHLTYGTTSFEVKDGEKTDYTNMIITVGVGTEKPINEDNVLVVGVEAGLASVTTDTKDAGETTFSTTTLPGIYVGVESRIASWLIGRVGAGHVNQTFTTESKPDGGSKSETTSDGSAFKITLGLGMEFSNFLVDFSFNEGLLFDGPALVSNTGEVLTSRLSITYNFGGDDEQK